jgi:transforming growth factor-beta-induced protein
MALPPAVLAFLLQPENKATLSQILGYHIVPGSVLSTDLSDGVVLSSSALKNLTITSTDTGGLAVNGANIVTPDLVATNGVIHIIDQVLIPPNIVLPVDIIETGIAAGFTGLVGAIAAAGLTETLKGGSYTVFAPTNDAFAALPAGAMGFLSANLTLMAQVLLYHVLPEPTLSNALTDGDQLATLEGSNLTVAVATDRTVTLNEIAIVGPADVVALNGVIHVIDTVLIPPSIMELIMANGGMMGNPDQGIFEVANATGIFTQLLGAIAASGLADALNAPGPVSKYTPDELDSTRKWISRIHREFPSHTTCLRFTTIIYRHSRFRSY